MRTIRRISIATAAVAALALTPTVAVAGDRPASPPRGHHQSDVRAVGLVDGTQLVTFSVSRPGDVRKTGTVRGLTGGDTELVGIDARVQDRGVYGVGNAGGVYKLDVHSARAEFVLRLTEELDGTRFGVDFNPAANALRIVSDTGQNLRQPFATPGAATVADTPLTTPPTAGTTTGVTAAGYTNNDLDEKTGTTLFVVNADTGALAIQSPANAGTLAATGNLGVDLGEDPAFDVRGTTGYLVVPAGERSTVYEVSLLTGQATKKGHVKAAVGDLALRLS
ncbi:DUF4394 domain-containing protein [Kineococcus gynurae]|uniref:DUF4394 domain-containing protein n=1 Tax=Kineococcus gynurae TaxID=452979 RepID=A0ABV5LPL3_9ACTN